VRFRNVTFHEDKRGNNELAVEYAALSYSRRRAFAIASRLRGYDRDWSPETSEVKTRYTNLPAFFLAREYAFEVTANNGDGVDADPAEPPVSRLAAGVVPVVGAGGPVRPGGRFLYGAHQYRTRSLERRARLLEHVVDVRTQSPCAGANAAGTERRTREQERRDRAHPAAADRAGELASLGALTAGIAHEIRNPLNFVNNFAELSGDLVQDLRDDITKQKTN
jgi:signal transduction histidine kinase